MTRTRQETIRLGILFTLVILSFAIFIARLVHLQLYYGDRYKVLVKKQSTGSEPLPAERGQIYDRNGQLVAKNVIRPALYAYPRSEEELMQVATFAENLFKLPPGSARTKYKLELNRFRYIKRGLSDDETRKVEKANVKGLFLREDSRRAYPFGTVGKQILGFTGIDNNGLSSFELAFDSMLTGTPGVVDLRRDGRQNTFRVHEEALVKPVPGTSVVLTVDWRLQDIIEEELQHAVDTFGAQAGMAVFMDCRNGDILGMAHFDPTEVDLEKPTKLRAISDQYEPGSVFKPFTAAAVIDAGLADYKRLIYCENGAWNTGSRILHDDKKHGWLNFREIIEVSSNIGIAKWTLMVDGNDLFDLLRRFGFGRKLDIGLPGEAAGRLVPPSVMSEYNIAAISMGHSISCTPLQLTAAMAAIANDGELLRPRLVLGEVGPDGVVKQNHEKEVLAQVMKQGHLDSLRAFLRGVVERGTAKDKVASKIVEIAGKTGTAELPNPEGGGYFKNKFVATFAGYFPADNPMIAASIMLIDPQPMHYGGWTSGPTFRRIAERYALLNPQFFANPSAVIAKQSKGLDSTVWTPNFVGYDVTFAQQLAEQIGVRLRLPDDSGTITWQFPPANRKVFRGEEIVLAVRSFEDSALYMPDLTGLPARQVTAFMTHAKIDFRIKGAGEVVSQSLPAGAVVTEDSVVHVECQPY